MLEDKTVKIIYQLYVQYRHQSQHATGGACFSWFPVWQYDLTITPQNFYSGELGADLDEQEFDELQDFR